MKDALSVITDATRGIGDKLAEFWEITPARVCEFLGKDNPYPKLRRLIRAIAAVTTGADRRHRLLIIKADFNALIDELLAADSSTAGEVECGILCDELYDVMRTKMKRMPKSERLKELREADVVIRQEINALVEDK